MSSSPLPAFKLGMDMLSDETSIPSGAARDAINIDFNRAGNFMRRCGCAAKIAGEGFHSLWSPNSRVYALVAKNGVLYRLDVDPVTTTAIFTLSTRGSVEYTEENGNIYFTDGAEVYWIRAGSDTPELFGVPTPEQAPIPLASTHGALNPGKYSVGFSYVADDGEESGLTAINAVTLSASGGITLMNLPANTTYMLRVYLTPPNGDVLYAVADIVPGMGQYLLGNADFTNQCTVFGKRRLYGGRSIRVMGGRVYTASGKTIYFTDAYRNLASVSGFVSIPYAVTFIEPVVDGMYIGSGDATWFLNGLDPRQSTLKYAHTGSAFVLSSVAISGEHFDKKIVAPDIEVALWLSEFGYVIGLPGGEVKALQADRIKLSAGAGRTAFVMQEGRKQLITTVGPFVAGLGTAVDSVSI